MTVGRTDPLYAQAVQQVDTALGAATGIGADRRRARHRRTPAWRRRSSAQAADAGTAADGADQLAAGAREAADGADQLNTGAERADDRPARLESGAERAAERARHARATRSRGARAGSTGWRPARTRWHAGSTS